MRCVKINYMSKFIELTVTTTHDGAELVADILSDYTELGVSIFDVQDAIDLEKNGKFWDYADETIYSADKTVFCKACYEKRKAKKTISEIEDRLNILKENSPFFLGSLETIKRETDGELWRKQWKEHFKPIHIGKVVIVPEWIKYKPQSDEKVVLLDSNMAFGTGEHETTSMCVNYIEKYVSGEDTVIDVGCGSGILGITALKLGAKKVVMTDIDECAVKAAKHNLKLNGLKNGEVLLKNLLDGVNDLCGDVLVCNIMAEVLIAFSPYLKNNLKSGGYVILSGILKDRLDKVKDAYIKQGYTFIEDRTEGEWCACVFKKV